MPQHPAVRSSFFIKFLLITAMASNLYLILQSIFHTINIHQLDFYLRWYGFNATPWLNLVLFVGTSLSLVGLLQVYKNGSSSYKIYFMGKLITCLGFLILMMAEYKNNSVPFPFILVPVLIAVEAIYPILLYLSLRKSKARR